MDKKCESCIYWKEPCVVECINCVEKSNFEPQTNADYIRAMSDEELADLIHNIGSYVENGELYVEIYMPEKIVLDDSVGIIEEWLKQPRKVEEI